MNPSSWSVSEVPNVVNIPMNIGQEGIVKRLGFMITAFILIAGQYGFYRPFCRVPDISCKGSAASCARNFKVPPAVRHYDLILSPGVMKKWYLNIKVLSNRAVWDKSYYCQPSDFPGERHCAVGCEVTQLVPGPRIFCAFIGCIHYEFAFLCMYYNSFFMCSSEMDCDFQCYFY